MSSVAPLSVNPNASGVLLEARHVSRVLAETVPVVLLDDVSVTFNPGEFVSITGPSGSGKSSLLYVLGLLDVPSRGSVLLEGRDSAQLSSSEIAHLRLQKLGFVFQFHFLLPEFTALGNVMIPLRKLGDRPKEAMRARAVQILESLGLNREINKRPDQMSGGQRQRVAIARALANAPRILLADEPTGNLDSRNAQVVFDIFARIAREDGCTVIVVTHEMELAAQADRQIVICDGKIESS